MGSLNKPVGRSGGLKGVRVRCPAPTDGVGKALRSVFHEPAFTLPGDMNALLDQLGDGARRR